MGIIPTELDKSINNEDLLSDKNHRKHTYTHTQTLTHALRARKRLNLILSPYKI